MALRDRGAGQFVRSQDLHARREVRHLLYRKVGESNLAEDEAQVLDGNFHGAIWGDLHAAVQQAHRACGATRTRVLSLRGRRVKARRRNKNDIFFHKRTALFQPKRQNDKELSVNQHRFSGQRKPRPIEATLATNRAKIHDVLSIIYNLLNY